MSIMTPSMDALLSQMRDVSYAASGVNLPVTPLKSSNQAAGASFAKALKSSLDGLAATQNSANNQANAFSAGTSKASLNDVMIDLQKASLAFETTVQVRNRFVQAYQSIASMPV